MPGLSPNAVFGTKKRQNDNRSIQSNPNRHHHVRPAQNMSRLIHRMTVFLRLCVSRARVWLHRVKGVNAAAKCNFGHRVRIDRSWTVSMGKRTTLEDNVWLKVEDDDARIVIGEFVFLGRGCEIDSTLSVTIGNKTQIAPNVFITDHNHNINRHQLIVDQGCTAKAVVIQDDVWIGAQAIILAGVKIHQGAVIAAGAVVNQNVPAYEVWGGVPARKISARPDSAWQEERSSVDD